jgi:hypothetical protein
VRAVGVGEEPRCHHRQAVVSVDQSVEKHNSSRRSIRSKQCCAGHECCRSTVRSQWAQPCLTAHVRAVAQTEELVPAHSPHFHGSCLSAHYPARAPPAL